MAFCIKLTKHDLVPVTKLIFVQIFFLALPVFKEKVNNLLDQVNISRISGWISGIRPDTGYQKRPDYPAGYPVHPYKKPMRHLVPALLK
jgi:hypothetical protein